MKTLNKLWQSKFVRVTLTTAGAALGAWLGEKLANLVETGLESLMTKAHGRHARRKEDDPWAMKP